MHEYVSFVLTLAREDGALALAVAALVLAGAGMFCLINMQNGTGLDLLVEIRQKGIPVPFLLMSGDDDCLFKKQTKFYGGVFCCKTDYDLIGKIKALINTETK